MRELHAYTLNDWPRRRNGELIFTTTNEAIYFAYIVEDRVSAYAFLRKWRFNTYQDIKAAREKKPIDFDRLFDLSVRAQLYREAMEEISRLNSEGL